MFPDSVSVPIASPGKSRKFYKQYHQTTQSFMKPRPIFCREVVPDRSMSVKTSSYVRANPMPVPIFGNAQVHNRAFFVPFRCVFPGWNTFIENTFFSYSTGSTAVNTIPDQPMVSNAVLANMFISNNSLTSTGTAASYDIVYNNNGTAQYYSFTEKGIDFLTVLLGLGYVINWNSDDASVFPALKLLAYGKVMIDWYYPSAYVGSSVYAKIQSLCNNYNSGILYLTSSDVFAILEVCQYCTYENDYLVNAWDYPIGPNQQVERSMAIKDMTNDAANIRTVTNDVNNINTPSNPAFTPSNGTPFIGGSGSTSLGTSVPLGVDTQYVYNALKSMTDFTLRHRIAGVRALDRYLAEYGISLKDEILKRSMYLGAQKFDMEFYDVFSHADTKSGTTGSRLGDYAGKGNGFSGDYTFELESQEFGVLIIVNSIVPEIMYTQGMHRENMHNSALDYWHGDYDHMMVQPISSREVYVPIDGSCAAASATASSSINENIFGWTSKYVEYNTPMNQMSGLYSVKSRSGLLPCYSLFRDLSWLDSVTLANAKHSVGFVVGSDASQFTRIFYVDKTSLNEDQFNCIHRFEVTNVDATLPPYESFDFEHDDKRKVEMQVNGSKLN